MTHGPGGSPHGPKFFDPGGRPPTPPTPSSVTAVIAGFVDTEVLRGRPFGDCAILWRQSVLRNVVPLEVNSHRIVAITCSISCSNISLVNVYCVSPGMICSHYHSSADIDYAYSFALEHFITI
jgi:hypothetical protein